MWIIPLCRGFTLYMPPACYSLSSWLSYQVNCPRKPCVQVTFILLNNGTRAIHIIFIIVNCCNCFILLLVIVVYLLLCPIHKLNFIKDMYVCTGKTWCMQGSVLSTVLGTYRGLEHIPSDKERLLAWFFWGNYVCNYFEFHFR